jgi:myo-inositol-1(or 4)-monophosphatase
VVGVIYNPFQHRMFTAIRGCGAYLNLTTPLPLKARPEPLLGLSSALVAVEWGSDRSGRNWDTRCKTIRRLASSAEDGGAMVHSLRCMGSAALNFCAIAAGYVDAFWVSTPVVSTPFHS